MAKVMVADDHPVFRQGLISLLKQYPDFEVVGEASNGQEAVVKAGKLKPDVIIMDVNMPGGDGIEATIALRQTLPSVRVLMLTVSEEGDNLFNAIKAGAGGYMLKNVALQELVDAVRRVASGEAIIAPTMAVKLLDEFRQGPRDKKVKEVLSVRERDILQLIAGGASNKEVAVAFFISETTVKAHLRNILEKLHVKNRAHAVALAVERGWLKQD